ncbi:MAG: carboxypeptidase M32 [Alphaproteobacteria bacterium]|nr:carboxypeptidase M32 [Alphaproteobacteria bacterium]
MTADPGSNISGAYGRLEEIFRRRTLIGEAVGVLGWDTSVNMPPGGAAARAEQMATLRVMAHELVSDSQVADLMDEATANAAQLDQWQSANLREMRRAWLHATAVPASLVAARSRATAAAEAAWRGARADDDFKALQPFLEEVLALTREAGAAKAQALGRPVYDALMDEYEPGADSARVVAILEDYAGFLPELLDAVLARQAREPDPVMPAGPFPVPAQRLLCRHMAETVGIDFDSARLDESLHPFSGGVPEDSRITTRYHDGSFLDSMMGVLHESGHAMYERGLPTAWRYQPVGDARGMTLHESQSLLIEMQVCRSREFFEWAAPVIARTFATGGPAWTPGNLHRLATRVEPSLIRVEADEVTYPAHIILRTRLERAMIAGDLAVAGLPGAWGDGMVELLGIRPPDDRLGCLQDIHWPDGAFGYFPTYSLGAMAAAQLAAAARTADPQIMPAIARGDFAPLMAWLRPNVHNKASLVSTDELLAAATGKPLGADAFKEHLRRRYLEDA